MTCRTYREAREVVVRVLARDFACPESAFHEPGISFHAARELPGRRAFPFRDPALHLATLGRGVVVSASPERLDWLRSILAPLRREDVFSPLCVSLLQERVAEDGQFMAGPDLKYVCGADDLQRHPAPADFEMDLLEEEGIARLCGEPDFKLDVRYEPESPRPQVRAAVARFEGKAAGIAVVRADCDELWQIGVDILPPFQGRGLGKSLVGEVASAVFAAGRVPYYSTDPGNVHSQALAGRVGFRPAWTELYAR